LGTLCTRSGGYAEVYKATDRKTGEAWALKVIFRDRVKNQKRLDQEIEALRRAQHPSIIRQYETIHTKERLYLMQDLCVGTEDARPGRHPGLTRQSLVDSLSPRLAQGRGRLLVRPSDRFRRL